MAVESCPTRSAAGIAPSAPRRRLSARRALLAGLLLGLSGCGMLAPPPLPPMPKLPEAPPPTRLELNLTAARDLNPTAAGQPAPLLVRVYALAGDGQLLGASSAALFADDRAALGADVLSREELRLLPGQTESIAQDLPAGTRALGVLAAYRQLDGVHWRAAAPVAAGEVNRFELTLGARGVKLAPAP